MTDIIFTPNEITTMKYELIQGKDAIEDDKDGNLRRHYQQIIEKLNEYYKAIT